jgi:hypothetical protein
VRPSKADRTIRRDALERWFAGALRPKLERAQARGVVDPAQVELLAQRLAPLFRGRITR